MFEPEKLPAPDGNGYFFHPDIPGEDEGDDVCALCLALGFSVSVVDFENDASEDLLDAYYGRNEETAVGSWSPSAPNGDGWQLVAKYGSEDGPCALFVQPICPPVVPAVSSGQPVHAI